MKRQEGFTLIELMVVILIIGILVAIAVPVFFSAQSNAQAGACQDNMRTIDSAIMQYSAGNTGAYPAGGSAVDATSVLVDTYLRDAPECPVAALTYTLDNGTPPRAVCPYVADPHTY